MSHSNVSAQRPVRHTERYRLHDSTLHRAMMSTDLRARADHEKSWQERSERGPVSNQIGDTVLSAAAAPYAKTDRASGSP